MIKMDTPDAAFTYVGGKSKRVRPDRLRLFEALLGTSFKTSGQALAGAASDIGYSAVHLRRLCNQEFGQPLGSFWNRMRLERAAGRLAIENSSVADIAVDAGYGSSQAFAKAFMAYFGCTPSAFRSLNSSECRFPGYLLSLERHPRWQRNVKVRTGPAVTITFIYDGPVFLGRRFSNGRIDWTWR
jgi:AraC-like DNA-binding protein